MLNVLTFTPILYSPMVVAIPKKLFSISAIYWRLEKIASIPFSLIANPAGFQNVASIPVAVAAAPPPERCLALGTTSNCVDEAEPILEL